MSLRLLGIDPSTGARAYGDDRYTAESRALVGPWFSSPAAVDLGGTVGVGPNLNPSSDQGGSGSPVGIVQGKQAQGDGPHYRPAAGLPPVGVLDYVQKLSTASLATIGLLVLLVVIVRNPRGAFHWVARSGARRAGLE